MAEVRKIREFSKRIKNLNNTFLSILLLFIASTTFDLVQISFQAMPLYFSPSL